MSVVPLYLRMLDDLTPLSLFDQDFGIGMLSDEMVTPRGHLHIRQPHQVYLRPWSRAQTGSSVVSSSKDEFKVNLDVKQFKPEEISVKIMENSVVINGKHEERQDEHGYISREFQRRYVLPADVDPKLVQSTLSSDGVLSVSAPKKQPAIENERSIPIVQTNQPAIKADTKKDGKTEKMEQ